MKTLLTRLALTFCSAFALASAPAAATTLSLSPATIQSDAIANIVYAIGSIAPGESVMVERFLDINANGAIDAGEIPVRRFTVVDGHAYSIGGVRNENIPGDDDGVQNSAIRADVPFPGADPGLERMDGRFVVRVTAAGGTAIAPLQVTQPNLPQRVSGTVMNAANNAPIPFAFVIVVPSDAPGIFTTTVANAAGAFSVALPPGNWGLYGSSGGFIAPTEGADVSVPAGQAVTHNVLMNATTTRILGRVVDSVSGAGISSLFMTAQAGHDGAGFIAVDVTDANGNFRLSVNPGEWEVDALDQSLQRLGYLPNYADVTVTGPEVTQNLTLPRATAMIYGRVARATGEPLPGFVLWVQRAGDDEDDNPARSINANGEYFIAVGPGTWEFGPEGSSLAPLRLRGYEQSVNIAANQALQRDFSFLGTTAVVAGRVVDQNGAPLPGVNFHGHFEGDDDGDAENGDTGPNGEFEIPVWGGNWRFHVGDDLEGMGVIESDIHLTVVDGVDQRNIQYVVLRANRQITGSVRTSGGQPVSNVAVRANATINGKDYQAFAETDGSGNFSLSVVDGSWSVSVDCFDLQQQNYSCPSNLSRVVSGGNQTANFTVNPPQVDAHLRGRVTDQSGNPIANITIGAYGNGPQRLTDTNPNGEFDLGVTAGSWSLQINGDPPAGKISPSLSFQVQQGVDVNNINFRLLDAPLRISGFVRNASGGAESDLFVFAGLSVDGVPYSAQAQTDGTGSYSLAVFNGDWQMWMDCSGVESRGYECPQLANANVQGANISRDIVLITPAAWLRGFVSDERGNRLSFTALQLNAGGQSRYFSSGQNGDFAIGVPTGPVELTASGQAGNNIPPSFNFNISQGVDINNIDVRMLDVDRMLSGSLRSNQGAALWGVDFYATATIDGRNYRIGNFDTTDQNGYVGVQAAYGTWTLHYDCDDILERGFVCPSPLPTYTLTSNSADFAVVVSPPVVQGASISNLQYTGGGSPIFRFRVTGSPGTYDIYRSETLLNGSWSNTGTSVTISPGGTFQDVILPVSTARGFYGAMRR